MIDIFQYTNYRLYLKACYEHHKSQNNAFSYRYFSSRCGYKSPNILKLVIDGKRNLSEQSIEKFSSFFKLKKAETNYFTLLVNFNQAKSSELRARLAQQIMKESTFKRIHPLGQERFEYYSKWYYVAIREILATKHFKLEAEDISELLLPKVSVSQVKSALEVLLRLGLIKKKNNRFVPVDEIVSTGDEVSSVAVATYHKEMLELGKESIDRFESELRDISSLTVSLSTQNIKELKLLISKFRKNVLELSEQDQAKLNVYQVGIQMFPLTKIKDNS